MTHHVLAPRLPRCAWWGASGTMPILLLRQGDVQMRVQARPLLRMTAAPYQAREMRQTVVTGAAATSVTAVAETA